MPGAGLVGEDLLDALAVFALQQFDLVDAPFDAGGLGGINFEFLGILAQAALEFLDLDPGRFEAGETLGDGGIEALQFAEASLGIAEIRRSGAEEIDRLIRVLDEARAVLRLPVALLQLRDLGRIERGVGDLLDLEAEQFDLLIADEALVAEFIELVFCRGQGLVGRAIGAPLGRGVGVGIEHRELAILRKERLVLVRTVQVDEQTAERFEKRKSAGRAIHELLVAGAENPFHHERIAFAGLKAAALEEGVDEVEIRIELENRLDRAEGFTRADEIVIGPFAEDELQGADDHRFARAGLAGHADKAGSEFPGEVVDEGEVLDF